MASRLNMLSKSNKNKTEKKINLSSNYDKFIPIINEMGEDANIAFFTDNPNIDQLINQYDPSKISVYTNQIDLIEKLQSYNCILVDISQPIPNLDDIDLIVLIVETDEFRKYISEIYRSIKSEFAVLYFGGPRVTRHPTNNTMDTYASKPLNYNVMYRKEPKLELPLPRSSSAKREVEPETVESQTEEVIIPFSFPKLEGIPSPSKNVGITGSKEWQMEFKEFIRSIIFNMITQKTELIEALTTEDKMVIWQIAFTHKTVDPDVAGHYGQLEKIGDAALKFNFIDYASSAAKNPRLGDEYLTNLDKSFMAQRYQSIFGRNMKLYQWVIFDPNVELTDKVNEDLFESFSGALVRCGDMIRGGLGNLFVRQLIEFIFKDADLVFQIEEAKRDPKTLLTQAYKSFVLGERRGEDLNVEPDPLGEGRWKLTIRLGGENFRSWIDSMSEIYHLPRPVKYHLEVTKEGKGKTAVTMRAINAILDELEKIYGIKRDMLVQDDIRKRPEYRFNPEFKSLVDSAYAKDPNIVKILIQSGSRDDKTVKVGEDKYFTLSGKLAGPEGIIRKLASAFYPTNTPIEMQLTRLINQYLSS